jgi:hypothetical protein
LSSGRTGASGPENGAYQSLRKTETATNEEFAKLLVAEKIAESHPNSP